MHPKIETIPSTMDAMAYPDVAGAAQEMATGVPHSGHFPSIG